MSEDINNVDEQAEDEGFENFEFSGLVSEDFFIDGYEREEEEQDIINLLCFYLASEEYSIDIMSIKEIVRLREFTEVPRSPDFISGIISLRGVIVPVFDLRKRLGLEAKEHDKKSRIIITRDESRHWGMIVDEVTHVIRVPESSIEPPPSIISGISAEFISGIAKYESKFAIIMNIKNVLDIDI